MTPKKFTWKEAMKTIDELNTASYLGHNDWRLPSVHELISLIDSSKIDPACKLPDTMPSRYWSATPDAIYPYYAWSVYFGHGYVYYDGSKAGNGYVRPVRSGPNGLEWSETL